MKYRNRKFLLASALIALLMHTSSAVYAYKIPQPGNGQVPKDENIEVLQKISKGVAAIAEKAKKAVVFVSISKTIKGMPFGWIDPFEFFFGPNPNPQQRRMPEHKQQGLGSGFFVDLDKGYILTNNHVVEEADEIKIKVANGETYDAKVVGRDKNTDVAVVEIKDKNFSRKNLDSLGLGNSDEIKFGDLVVALGAPFGLEASLSFGVISALGRGSLSITALGNFIQTDAAINPGNSGGPLLNTSGEVIGMNTAIYSRSGGYNGIGFAIPSNLARLVAEQLINEGKVDRGYIGVAMNSNYDSEFAKDLGLPKDTRGVLIANVSNDSPAEKAGLEPGDVIVEVEGQKINSESDLQNIVGLRKPGSKIAIVYYREGKRKATTVKLGSFPATEVAEQNSNHSESDDFGMALSPVVEALKQKFKIKVNAGAVVTHIEPGSAAERSGLEAGDVIVKVKGQKVDHPKDFLKAAKDSPRLLILIDRQGERIFVTLRK